MTEPPRKARVSGIFSSHGGLDASPTDPFRQVRTARWMAILLTLAQFAIYEPSLGTTSAFSRWWVIPLVAPLAVVNLLEANLVRPHPLLLNQAPSEGVRADGLRTLSYLGVAVEAVMCLTLIAMFASDPNSALWAVMLLPIIDGGIRFRLQGALAVWALLGAAYAAVEVWAASAYTHRVFMLDSVSFRLGVTFLTAWTTGQLTSHLSRRMREFRSLNHVGRTTRSFTAMSPLEVSTVMDKVATDLGFGPLTYVWRTEADAPWESSLREIPRGTPLGPVALHNWVERLLTASQGHSGLLVLNDTNPANPKLPAGLDSPQTSTLDIDTDSGSPKLYAQIVGVENDPRLVMLAPAPHAMSPSTLATLEVLLMHGASAMMFAFQHHAHQEVEAKLAHQAAHDALTALPNRASLTEHVAHHLETSRGHVAVMILDLDRFKDINDTLGHAYGDELLVEVARLLSSVHHNGLVARLGGDEFGVVAPGLRSVDEAYSVALGLATVVQHPVTLDDVSLDISVSIGVAVAPLHGRTSYDLIRCADIAMYQAKRDQSGVAVYDKDLDDNSPERLSLLGDLRRALVATDELFLVYQPQVSLVDGTVVGVEALVRWNHPTRGLVMPGEFVPFAENTGLIMPLTVRVLDAAVHQVARWREQGLHLPVSVNVSPRCLLDPTLHGQIVKTLARHDVPAHLLHLEITEGALIQDPASAVEMLTELSSSGILISIDDFGTGFSSLSYLRSLPVGELKVDQSFVAGLGHENSDAVLARSIIDLGHTLGLRVVAEGVESTEALAELTAMGCDVVQGYLLARPMPAPDVSEWIHARGSGRPDSAVAPSPRLRDQAVDPPRPETPSDPTRRN